MEISLSNEVPLKEIINNKKALQYIVYYYVNFQEFLIFKHHNKEFLFKYIDFYNLDLTKL